MDTKFYNHTREKDFIGKRVVNLTSLSNGLYRFPAGLTWIIRRKKGGFELLSDPCQCCGIQAYISKVPAKDVNLVEQLSLWSQSAKKE